MRLRPVAPIMILDANVDTALGDILLPKGTGVAVLPRPPALDQTNFVDPFAFRPGALAWGIASGPHECLLTHLPAPGFGSATCAPGRSLALLEMEDLPVDAFTKTLTLSASGSVEGCLGIVRLHDVACGAQGAAAFPAARARGLASASKFERGRYRPRNTHPRSVVFNEQ